MGSAALAILQRLPECLNPKWAMVDGCFHCGLALFISQFQVSFMRNVQRDCTVIDRSEDRSLSPMILRIHVSAERQQFLPCFRKECFVQRTGMRLLRNQPGRLQPRLYTKVIMILDDEQDPQLDKWAKNLRSLTKVELEQKAKAISHAIYSNRERNRAAGQSLDTGTERLMAQLEICNKELAMCDSQTRMVAIAVGTEPVGIDNPLPLGSVRCPQCQLARSLFAPLSDINSLEGEGRKALMERATARVIEKMMDDHRLMERHPVAISVQLALKQ